MATDAKQLFWQELLKKLRCSINDQDWDNWFSQSTIVELSAHKVIIEVANEFAARWIQQHFYQLIEQCVIEVASVPLKIEIRGKKREEVAEQNGDEPHDLIINELRNPRRRTLSRTEMTEDQLRAELAATDQLPSLSLTPASVELNDHSATQRKLGGAGAKVTEAEIAELTGSTELNPAYQFSNYVVGIHNKIAHAAGLRVAESLAQSYNPLFIYGPTGSGKTHLMQAIGNRFCDLYPGKKVAYLTTEQFLHRFSAVIQRANTDRAAGRVIRQQFKDYFRTVDLLILDDIQLLQGRFSFLQDELFHIFNALHEAGKQVILGSDEELHQISGLEERLQTRFAWGLSTELKHPDKTARIVIIRKMLHSQQITLDDLIIEYLADNVTGSVRALEGALTKVIAQSSFGGEKITLELCESMIAKSRPVAEQRLTIKAIQKEICNHFDVQPEQLLSNSRARQVSLPRQLGMYLSRQLIGAPSSEVAESFNRRDHSTVLYAEKKVKSLVKSDAEYRTLVKNITEKLQLSYTGVSQKR